MNLYYVYFTSLDQAIINMKLEICQSMTNFEQSTSTEVRIQENHYPSGSKATLKEMRKWVLSSDFNLKNKQTKNNQNKTNKNSHLMRAENTAAQTQKYTQTKFWQNREVYCAYGKTPHLRNASIDRPIKFSIMHIVQQLSNFLTPWSTNKIHTDEKC